MTNKMIIKSLLNENQYHPSVVNIVNLLHRLKSDSLIISHIFTEMIYMRQLAKFKEHDKSYQDAYISMVKFIRDLTERLINDPDIKS